MTKPTSRKRLRDEYNTGQHAEVILQTLEEWLAEQGSNATLAALLQLLRDHELNSLFGKHFRKAF